MALRLAAVAALVLLLVRPSDLESCGPFFRTAVFVRHAVPEDEEAFFSGKIGIVQTSWWRRYLAMSYRILKGIPLNRAQVDSLLEWPERPDEKIVQEWLDARLQVPGTRTTAVDRWAHADAFQDYLGCGDDAFKTAIATLRSRIREAGADSTEVRDWLAAQDAVFSTCNGKGSAPAAAVAGSNAREQADRAYQIAAANFYLAKYDDAKSGFLEIAADRRSPWRPIAPYLAARCDVRKGDYPTAEAELQALSTDSRAARLLDLVEAKLHPSQQLTTLGKRLLVADSTTLAQDLIDYTFLYDKGAVPKPPEDEITIWIESIRGGNVDDHYRRWQQERTMPWLVAALVSADKNSAHVDELVDAARAVPLTSAAWASARFHAIRLSTPQQGRTILAEIRPDLKDMPLSTVNAFRGQQLQFARNLDEFLAAAPRKMAGTSLFGNDENEPTEHAELPMLDKDVSLVLDARMPLSGYVESIRSRRLPARLRNVVARAGFARAVILDDSSAQEFAKDLNLAYTDRFSAIFWMLHHPEASPFVRGTFPRSNVNDVPDGRIDDFRDNWWCAAKSVAEMIAMRSGPGEQVESPSFLNAAQRREAAREVEVLVRSASAPTFFATTVLAWAKEHPEDPRLPEALALTVKTSRFGCTDPKSAKVISAAFRLLHSRWPNSVWAKRTPYWYR